MMPNFVLKVIYLINCIIKVIFKYLLRLWAEFFKMIEIMHRQLL